MRLASITIKNYRALDDITISLNDHMNVIYGRYLLAAVWYKTITGNNICNNSYIPSTKLAPNAICDENVLKVIKEIVDTMTIKTTLR